MSAINRVTRSRVSERILHQQQRQEQQNSLAISKISFRSRKHSSSIAKAATSATNITVSSSTERDLDATFEATTPLTNPRKRSSSSLLKGSSEDDEAVVNGMRDSLPISEGSISLFDSNHLAVATQHLKMVDARLSKVIDMQEAPKFTKSASSFASLVRSIVYQQLSTKAASTIYGRLVSLCGEEADIIPNTILKLSAADLRLVGISERKASYLHDLARKFIADSLSDSAILLMDDSSLMSALTEVKGIGVWSVHMFMIFSLHRSDVLPVGDLAIRKGFQKLYDLKSLPDAATMEKLSSKWRPYRSLGSWYLWRILTKASTVSNPDNN